MPATILRPSQSFLDLARRRIDAGEGAFREREFDPQVQYVLSLERQAEAVRRKHERITWEQKEHAFRLMGFVPTPKQQEIAQDAHQIRVMRAGRRSGKTTHAAAEAVATMIEKPGSFGWIMGPYFNVTERCWKMIVKWLEKLDRLGIMGIESMRDSSPNYYARLTNGSVVEGRSADTADTNQGVGLDWLIMDEVAQIEPFVLMEVIIPAIIQQEGWALLIGTPLQEHWASVQARKDRLQAERTGERQIWSEWVFESWHNTYEFPGGRNDPKIRDLRRMMDRHVYMEQVMARPQRSPYVVYPEFVEEIHATSCPYQPGNPVYLSIDPGGTNIYAVAVFHDFGNRIEMIDEYYEPQQVAPSVIHDLKDRAWWKDVQLAIVDDAAPGDVRMWKENEEVHFAVTRANKPKYIEDSIPLVKQWLRTPATYNYLTEPLLATIVAEKFPDKDWADLDLDDHKEVMLDLEEQLLDSHRQILEYSARLFFDAYRCQNAVKEFMGLHVKKPKKEDRNLPEVPIPHQDHLADACRYFCWNRKRHFGMGRAEPTQGEEVA